MSAALAGHQWAAGSVCSAVISAAAWVTIGGSQRDAFTRYEIVWANHRWKSDGPLEMRVQTYTETLAAAKNQSGCWTSARCDDLIITTCCAFIVAVNRRTSCVFPFNGCRTLAYTSCSWCLMQQGLSAARGELSWMRSFIWFAVITLKKNTSHPPTALSRTHDSQRERVFAFIGCCRPLSTGGADASPAQNRQVFTVLTEDLAYFITGIRLTQPACGLLSSSVSAKCSLMS